MTKTQLIIILISILVVGVFIWIVAHNSVGASYNHKYEVPSNTPCASPTVESSATPLPSESPVASESAVPTATPVATPTPNTGGDGGSDNLGCSTHDCSNNQIGSPPQSAFVSEYDGSRVGAK